MSGKAERNCLMKSSESCTNLIFSAHIVPEVTGRHRQLHNFFQAPPPSIMQEFRMQYIFTTVIIFVLHKSLTHSLHSKCDNESCPAEDSSTPAKSLNRIYHTLEISMELSENTEQLADIFCVKRNDLDVKKLRTHLRKGNNKTAYICSLVGTSCLGLQLIECNPENPFNVSSLCTLNFSKI